MRMTETQLAKLLSAERPSEFAVCFHGVQADRVIMDGHMVTVFRLVGHTNVLTDDADAEVPDRDMVAIDFVTGDGGLMAILCELMGDEPKCDEHYPVTIPTMEIMHRVLGGNPDESS